MKIKIYLLSMLLTVSCANKGNNQISLQPYETEKHETDSSKVEYEDTIERNLLREFPDYFKGTVAKGKFDSDNLTDYFYILYPDFKSKENRNTSRCVLIFGSEKKGKQRRIVFDDLLPTMMMSGKIEEPFETVRLSNDTLFVCFVSSPYGHNEFYKESYTFKFNTEYHFFSLMEFKYEVCILPECEYMASIVINEGELVNSKLPFSYSNWLYYSPDNVLISKHTIPKWKHFSIELKKIGLEYESKTIEDKLF